MLSGVMLPAAHRMRRRRDFDVAFSGRRAGSATVLVSVAAPGRPAPGRSPAKPYPEPAAPDEPPLVGLVVSRAVGGAVDRNRVKRRLRAAIAPHVPALPPGARVVLRARPSAAVASYDELTGDLARALRRAGAVASAGSVGTPR
jgi:ribonuclease P protein component